MFKIKVIFLLNASDKIIISNVKAHHFKARDAMKSFTS